MCYETQNCHARRHNGLEGHNNFSSSIYNFSILCLELLWRSTVAFTYLKVKYAKCLCLLPVVLVLLFWSWFSKQRSCLVPLVFILVLVLRIWSCLRHCYKHSVIGVHCQLTTARPYTSSKLKSVILLCSLSPPLLLLLLLLFLKP